MYKRHQLPDHFWKLRRRKSALRCGAKHISKSKCRKHISFGPLLEAFFPTCQVRVVRFYVSCLLLPRPPPPPPLLLSSSSSSSSLSSLSSLSSSSSSSNCDPRSTVFSAGPQPRPSTPSVPCRTSTTTSHAQCSLPDLNHDQPRPVFPAGPQPRVSTPSVPCRTSCRKIWDKECAEEC